MSYAYPWQSQSQSPQLLGPSLSRGRGGCESRFNRGQSNAQEDDESVLEHNTTALPPSMELPSDVSRGFNHVLRQQRSEYLGDRTPRASHQQQRYGTLPAKNLRNAQSHLHLQGSGQYSGASSSSMVIPKAAYLNANPQTQTSSLFNTSIGKFSVDPNQNSINISLSIHPFQDPGLPILENGCHCNNIICTLFGSDSRFMNEAATTEGFTHIAVVLGMWRIHVEGRVSHSTGERKPVRVKDLVNVIHAELHKLMGRDYQDNILAGMSDADAYKTKYQVDEHAFVRTGIRMHDTNRMMYLQKVDYVEKNNTIRVGPALYVKRLYSQQHVCIVGLA
ncbi:uncharacterized protein FOMMEDRAFT_27318 [Fomitiporia mediterranea MF3/22]|uniref:uncharacterized protein n=1 Tax=Fomitiporia mediterranea (strain MF3/22) TaxID=694068 RepID=UPI00044090A7|nr:uncharacterized protein FOMMEDRAFT_27318 [Fomitiporia mediterranea MF3/22]EJD05084.1 hypothetical protein FOMMEDRAFT_27318 [Fomitiporia mediterranea MF3/22]